LLTLVTCAGCKLDARVTVDVERSGAGTVSVRVVLDRDAADRLGDPATALRLEDLRAAGWQVDAPAANELGVTLNASKRFESPGDLQAVLDEVGGRDGVFRGWSLHVDDGFASTSYSLAGGVHLTGGLEQFSDSDLATALDGLPLGRTPDEMAAALGPDRDAVTLTVHALLPASGDAEEHVSLGGGPQDRTVRVATELRDGAPARWLILAGACVAIAGLLVVAPRLRRS
jgi:hypothetical protein